MSIIEPALLAGKDLSLYSTGKVSGDFFVGVDLAVSESPKADYTSIFVGELDGDDRVVIRYIVRDRLGPAAFKDKISEINGIFKPKMIGIEADNIMKAYMDELTSMGLPVEPFPKDAKPRHQRLIYQRLQFINERVIIPDNRDMSSEQRDLIRIYVEELTNMAFQESPRTRQTTIKSIMAHDDTVFSSAVLLDTVRQFSVEPMTVVGSWDVRPRPINEIPPDVFRRYPTLHEDNI